jgi:hypothetical protein
LFSPVSLAVNAVHPDADDVKVIKKPGQEEVVLIVTVGEPESAAAQFWPPPYVTLKLKLILDPHPDGEAGTNTKSEKSSTFPVCMSALRVTFPWVANKAETGKKVPRIHNCRHLANSEICRHVVVAEMFELVRNSG